MTAPTVPHAHRWVVDQPHEGLSHGVCACGAERDFHDPDWVQSGGPHYRRERTYAKCPHCGRRFHAKTIEQHKQFCQETQS